jgi:glutathione S-transferase
MNPNGTVPVLCDGDGEPLWDTGAILRYLAGRYGSVRFWPAEGPARAHVDRWAEWAKINVTLGFTAPIFWRVVRTAPSKRNPAAIDAAVSTLDSFLDIAEAQLSRGAFLAGDDLTPADIQFVFAISRAGACARLGRRAPQPLERPFPQVSCCASPTPR